MELLPRVARMLSLSGCRSRQQRFCRALADNQVDAALITHPRDIYYFSGLWVENRIYEPPSVLLIRADADAWLATWTENGQAAVDQRESYPPKVLSTTNPDNHRRLAGVVQGCGERLRGKVGRLGVQAEGGPRSLIDAFADGAAIAEIVDVDDLLMDQQLRKDPDEIESVRAAQRANLAGYRRATEVIRPGVSELEVLTECYRAAILESGKQHFYSGDFQSGRPGGFARDRRIEEGEIYIIDAWNDAEGYWSDLSRAWVVGGRPTDLQASVYQHLATVLEAVPSQVKPGMSCTGFWHWMDQRIREHPFMEKGLIHHGGHGIGLRPHEGPDINRDRDAVFEIGNVFTAEPGYYHPDLRAGFRLENNFVLTEQGVEVVSPFPLQLVP